MSVIQGIVLGIIQGLTEFIPISSSAHLVLVPWAFGWQPPGLFYDTMVHWGTLLAVVAFFWRDWLQIIRGMYQSLKTPGPWTASPGGRLVLPDSRLGWGILIGTVPAAVAGFLFEDFFERLFETPAAVGGFLLVTAAILIASERWGRRVRGVQDLRIPDALLIGLAQAAAIAPGISRSGATIAAGLGRGLTREAAARFSFLLSCPAILGAGVLQVIGVVSSSEPAPTWGAAIGGFIAAAVSGYLCVKLLLSYLRRGRLYVFAAYCALLGTAALVFSLYR